MSNSVVRIKAVLALALAGLLLLPLSALLPAPAAAVVGFLVAVAAVQPGLRTASTSRTKDC